MAVEHYVVIRDRTLEIAAQKHFTSGVSLVKLSNLGFLNPWLF